MFIRINNRNNFLLGSVKTLHPESNEYIEYWRKLKKLSIEGFWSLDKEGVDVDPIESNIDRLAELNKDGWRWMPPNLFFYANLGTIRHNPPGSPKTAPKKKIRPFLRDIEWEFFYNWIECRGFSGFTNDNEYQCLRESKEEGFSKEEYKTKNCYDENGKFIEEKWHNLVNRETGEIKKYIPAREYLRKLHSRPLGNAMWENMAKNLLMLGARGYGKSFSVGVGVILHELLFDGSRRYTQESIEDPFTVEILVGAAQSGKSSDLLSKTVEALDDIPGSWGAGDDEEPSPMYKRMSGSIKPNNVKNPWIHWNDIDEGSGWKKEGSKSNIKHVTFSMENPEAAAGTRPGIIVVEEVGLCSNILTVHGSNSACQMEGETKFGSSIYLGTGGNMEKIVEAEKMFYDPEGYDFLSFDNEWEADTRKIGWFVPAIYGLNNYKDKNGNTDIEKALEYKNGIRRKKMKARDTSAIDLEMMNYPLVPSEMFLSKNGNIFPVALIAEQLSEIEGNDKYYNAEYIGELVADPDTDRILWKVNSSKRPIREFPLDDSSNKEGALVIYEHPDLEVDGTIQYGRYIAGCDPYDHDAAGTTSLGSTIVYDRLSGRVVAEYTGRPTTAKEYYEYVRKILIYYNAKLLYENERKGIFDYFESKNAVFLLQEQPKYIKDIIQNSKVERGYGMHMNSHLKRYGEELIKTWLLETISGKGDTEVLNVHKLRCLPLLKEMKGYNPEGNFDRCLTKGTSIRTCDGVKNIEDIQIGDLVITSKGNIKPVTNKINSRFNGKIIELNISGEADNLIVTNNHPILIASTKFKKHNKRSSSLNNIKFKRADELTNKYQFALIPKRRNLKKTTISDDLLYLLGWSIGDGYVNKNINKLSICLQGDQMLMAKKLKKIIDNYCENEPPTIYNNRKYKSNECKIKDYGTYIRVSKTSKKLTNLLLKNGCEPGNKLLTNELYNSKGLIPLVIGLLEADGHQKFNNIGKYNRCNIEISTVYKTLLTQIRQILIDENIYSSISNVKKGNQLKLNISTNHINKLLSYYESLKFIKCNFKCQKEIQLINKDGFWTPIKIVDITDTNIKTYNIEVKDDHTYIANNIATHNCMSFMMVMYFIQETRKIAIDKANERNIVDLASSSFFNKGINSPRRKRY